MWRGALLAKAASFKKISEDIQINHEIGAKSITKTIEKTVPTMMRKNIEKYHQKYRQPCDLGSHFGAICMIVSRGGAFF